MELNQNFIGAEIKLKIWRIFSKLKAQNRAEMDLKVSKSEGSFIKPFPYRNIDAL